MNRIVIFDLDGTLIDTPSGIAEAFQVVFQSLGVEGIQVPAIKNTIGLPLEQAFGNLLGVPADHQRVTGAIALYQQAFARIILPKAATLLFPGVVEGLAALREEGCVLAIATSKYYRSADALLGAAAIRDCFRLVVGADQVQKPKPDREMGLKIINALGGTTAGTLMVGDTTHDIHMATALGIRSVAVTYGVHGDRQLYAAQPTWMARSFSNAVNYIHNYFKNYA